MSKDNSQFRIGLSTCHKEICEDLFKAYQCAGITDMELENGRQTCNDLDYKLVQTWARRYDVRLWSYHLPFKPHEEVDISKWQSKNNAVMRLSEFIKKASDIGIDKFVIHPSGEPIADDQRKDQMECAKESLAKLAEIAAQNGAVVAVEDLPRTCLGRNSDEILELISGHPALRVCFDTNHLLSEDILAFIRKVGNKIVTLHVSDYDFINERHWLPGEGDIDWQAVLAALKEVGYQGPWLYEIGFNPPATIDRRRLEVADFAANANALFMGKKPIAIGERKKNLGMWGVIEKES